MPSSWILPSILLFIMKKDVLPPIKWQRTIELLRNIAWAGQIHGSTPTVTMHRTT